MTGNQTLTARAALGVVTGIVSVAAVSSSRLRALPRQTFDRLMAVTLIVSRLAMYLGIFFVLRLQPRGDIPAYYWEEANYVLRGHLPYRDFYTSYAPLHPYLDAFAIRLWFTPLAIILLAICVEWLLLPIWLRVGRSFLSEQELRTGALFYLCSAVSLQFVAIDGQDNVIIATLLAFAVLLLYRNRFLASGAAVGMGVATIKFLPLLYVPAFFVAVPRRWRWVAGIAIPIGVVYGALLATHVPILGALTHEGHMKTANNLPYLIEAIVGITPPPLFWDSLVLASVAILFVLIANAVRRASPALRLRTLTFGMAALTLALLLFSKKSWPPYLMLTLFPICLLVPAQSRLKSAAFALFGVVAVVGPSYWATVYKQFSAQAFHQGLLAHQKGCFVFLGVQCLLVLGYAWLLLEAIRLIIASPNAAAQIEVSAQAVSVRSA
ncbi:MAG: hypothetical protein JWQ42_2390 [Edaphobacter sp.]|nr:hypothetical protein [Edaphobacter sp.]